MSKLLRIAVVGAGQMGRHHIRVVSENPLTEVTAVVDPSPAAEQVAYAARADWVTTVQALEAADAAIVSVPTSEHAAVSSALLARGVPLLVEKPLAASVEEGERLVQEAEAAGVTLAVGHVERFNPAVRALREKLTAGELGRIFQIRAQRLSPFPSRVGDAGVAFDLATHDLDVMCDLAGRPVRVSAEIDRQAHRSHEDMLAALLRFDSGIIGLLEVNWLTPAKVRRLTVTGERGMFEVDYLAQHLTLYENAHESVSWQTLDIFDGVTEGNATRFAIPRAEPLALQLKSFVAAIRGEAPVVVGGEDGLQALRLATSILESGTRGEAVAVG
jgi:UDP-N-acetylglucosamine 3-dehydrogenase